MCKLYVRSTDNFYGCLLYTSKMDQEGTDRKHLLEELKNGLDDQIMAFDVEKDTSFYENAAMGDERALEEYLEAEKLTEETIAGLIMERKVDVYKRQL